MNRPKQPKPFKSKIEVDWDPRFNVTTPVSKATETIALQQIQLPQQQPRRYFDPQAHQELVCSIEQHGILQPLLVRPLASGNYELVAGERRYRAALEIGLREVPVVVKELTPEQAWQLALVENLQREDLNPVEETEGILELLALRLGQSVEEVVSLLYRLRNQAKAQSNQKAIAKEETEEERRVSYNVIANSDEQVIYSTFNSLGRMTLDSFIINRLPLRKLPPELLTALQQGRIAYTKAMAIARVKDEAQRKTLLSEAIEQQLSLSQIKVKIQEFVSCGKAQQSVAEPSLSQRLEKAYRQVTKKKVWLQPHKRQQLEALLVQLEALAFDK